MDFYMLSIGEIEKELNIAPFDHTKHEKKGIRDRIFDDWEEAAEFIKELRNDRNMHLIVSCLGYELVEDNHKVKVYYKITHSFS
ncbi:hypothetical protein QTG56_22685 (plasmid) [Rossellomorea sp. AcN35-11]|nr:hypothetical protein [Rossellomorea aquimaris]WJV32180.1 hypothetical protein QTG56_22685 [Rossellomorea sp. AcN35-11]